MGFLPRVNVTRATAVANWYFFKDAHPWLRRIWPGALAFATFRNGSGVLESGQYAAWVQWDTKAGGGGWVEPKLFVEDVQEAFAIGGAVEIPRGRYTFADLQLVYSMPTGRRLRTDVDFRAGTFFDGERVQAVVTPTRNASRHLELAGSYQLTRCASRSVGSGPTSTWRAWSCAPRSTRGPPRAPSSSTTPRPTGWTRTCVSATTSPRAPTCGSSTTRAW